MALRNYLEEGWVLRDDILVVLDGRDVLANAFPQTVFEERVRKLAAGDGNKVVQYAAVPAAGSVRAHNPRRCRLPPPSRTRAHTCLHCCALTWAVRRTSTGIFGGEHLLRRRARAKQDAVLRQRWRTPLPRVCVRAP